ncbi:hypothetical protein TWF730_009895 [Orbilia blumenaviensis]|uniref:Uncharacterized protein n=1 Tax=Orbilia blumenaviensis TaxID=1796055 RepID=A0AAV9UWB2_9PEZI
MGCFGFLKKKKPFSDMPGNKIRSNFTTRTSSSTSNVPKEVKTKPQSLTPSGYGESTSSYRSANTNPYAMDSVALNAVLATSLNADNNNDPCAYDSSYYDNSGSYQAATSYGDTVFYNPEYSGDCGGNSGGDGGYFGGEGGGR